MKKILYIVLLLVTLGSLIVITSPAFTQEKPQAESIEVLFSPDGGIQERIKKEIDKAKSSIDIAIFCFTDDTVAEEIADALITRTKKAGVKIRLIVDAMQAGRFNSDEYLKDNGIDVITMTGKGNGKMHHKFIIFDDKKVMTGSYNISKYAEQFNYENVIFITDEAVVKEYIAEFVRLCQSKPKISRKKGK